MAFPCAAVLWKKELLALVMKAFTVQNTAEPLRSKRQPLRF
jgi:hypothetical protein